MNQAKVTVRPDQLGATVSPSMYGIFYEDINHAGDGGLYAELVRNRSFMDARVPKGTWYYGGQIRTLQRWSHPFSIEDPLPEKLKPSSVLLSQIREILRFPTSCA